MITPTNTNYDTDYDFKTTVIIRRVNKLILDLTLEENSSVYYTCGTINSNSTISTAPFLTVNSLRARFLTNPIRAKLAEKSRNENFAYSMKGALKRYARARIRRRK